MNDAERGSVFPKPGSAVKLTKKCPLPLMEPGDRFRIAAYSCGNVLLDQLFVRAGTGDQLLVPLSDFREYFSPYLEACN